MLIRVLLHVEFMAQKLERAKGFVKVDRWVVIIWATHTRVRARLAIRRLIGIHLEVDFMGKFIQAAVAIRALRLAFIRVRVLVKASQVALLIQFIESLPAFPVLELPLSVPQNCLTARTTKLPAIYVPH